MNYVLLLAGGKGTRMGNTGVPKQFLTIKDKPIIVHSIENMLKNKEINRLVVVCNPAFTQYLHNILIEYNLSNRVEICDGGTNRFESAFNGLTYIKEKYGFNKNDVFMVQDSVRIFTSERIVHENFENAHKYGAATTVCVLEETVVEANNDGLLCKTYPREHRYTDQSPQAFNLEKFYNYASQLDDAQKESITDLAEILFMNGENVYPVMGEKENIKLTTPFDMILANLKIEEKDTATVKTPAKIQETKKSFTQRLLDAWDFAGNLGRRKR